MIIIRKAMLLMLAAVMLSACALFEPNPVDVGTKYKIETEANSAALKAEQDRIFAEQNQAAKLANDEAAALKRQALMKTLYQVGSVFGGIALAIGLVGVGVGVGYSAIGTGQAVGIAAKFKATLIYPDPTTGQFPQFPFLVHDGPKGKLWALVDPGSHSSILLNVNNKPDAQSIVNAGYLAALGVSTRNGRVVIHQGEQLPVDQPQIPLIVQNESRE